MKRMMMKAIMIALIGGTTFAMSGCYGPFRLTTKLHNWNGQVSQKKFVNELLFLGLCIIPAYELCVLGDALIFNSIEWWGGRNPISMKDGQIEETKIVHDGQQYKVIKTKNQVVIVAADDQKAEFRYFPEEKSWYQMDGESRVKVVDMKGEKVYTYLPNEKVLTFDRTQAGMIEQEVTAAWTE